MMRRSLLIASVGLGVVAAVLLATSGTVWFERPTVVRVAVSTTDAEDFDLMGAAAKLLKRNRNAVRLKVVGVDGPVAASAAIDSGAADLAVVRTDVAVPADGATVVVLHKDVGLLMAPGGSDLGKVGELAGKTIGVLSQRIGDGKLLDAALGQYDIAPEAVKLVPLALADVGAAFKAKTVDAVFAVGLVSSGLLPAAVKATAAAGEGPPVFLPVAEADAIAQRLPTYESIEVVRGAFGGAPPRPAEEFDSLGVTYRLVARDALDGGVVADLTRFFLNERLALAALAPVARRIEAPSTDKGAAMPVHAGTAAYIDDEEETFLDRYSDFIYIGAMVLGVLASGATAVFSRIGSTGGVRAEDLVARLLVVFRAVRSAPGGAALDSLEAEVDDIVALAFEGGLRSLDERRVAMLTMAIDQVRAAIRDRRDLLRHGFGAGSALPGGEGPVLIEEVAGPTLKVVSHQAGSR